MPLCGTSFYYASASPITCYCFLMSPYKLVLPLCLIHVKLPLHFWNFKFLVSGHGLACQPNFIGFSQSSTHPLLEDRWIARPAITQGRYVLSCVNRHAYAAPGMLHLYANVIYASWRMPRTCWFWIFGLKHLFSRWMHVVIQMKSIEWCLNDFDK